jgi:predicted Zn-dependent protease
MQLAIDITDKLILPAWSRNQEQTADYFAIDLTTHLGYSYVRGMKSLLEKYADLEQQQAGREDAERKKRFENLAKLNNQASNALVDTLKNELIATVSRKHYYASERLDSCLQYRERFYAEKQKSMVHEADWKRVRNDRSVTQAIANYDLAYQAKALLDQGKVPPAIHLAQQAVTWPTADHAMPNLVLASALLAKGDNHGFERVVKRVVDGPAPTWQIYRLYAEYDMSHGRRDQARATMERGFKRFNEPPGLQPELIVFYERIGDQKAASDMQLSCAVGSPEIREKCTEYGTHDKWRANAPGQVKKGG